MRPLPLLISTLILCASACPAQTLNQDQENDQQELAGSSNAFAIDLYGQLRGQPGNLFFSPQSISTAFGMAYAGARGQTATEMARVLHFTLPPERLHAAMAALLANFNGAHQGYELHVADALWAQQDAGFLPAYLDAVKANYGAGFRAVDFHGAPEDARAAVNEWVEQQTNGKIANILGPGSVTPATRMLLTNAIYFKGAWLNPFDAFFTHDEDFYLTAKQTAKVPMMNQGGGYYYYDGGSFQEIQLFYDGSDLAMIILLPKKNDGLGALEKSFTAAAAATWIKKLQLADNIVLTLPRFTMTQQFELSSTLEAMGMEKAFSSSADFSGMTGKANMEISAAIHKAFIDVNEKGTEAAAATVTEMVATAYMEPDKAPPIVFCADHPFLFFIRNTATGSILFLGRVEDPR